LGYTFKTPIISEKNIMNLEYRMKTHILNKYTVDDFHFDRLFISVTPIQLPISSNIYYKFQTLEEAIDCCIASSHIPFITGGLFNKYKNIYALDGGLHDKPYLLRNIKPTLHISMDMFPNNSYISQIGFFERFIEFFSFSKNNLMELFIKGYTDAQKNVDFLDSVFLYTDTDLRI
jgi:hypothetical protein